MMSMSSLPHVDVPVIRHHPRYSGGISLSRTTVSTVATRAAEVTAETVVLAYDDRSLGRATTITVTQNGCASTPVEAGYNLSMAPKISRLNAVEQARRLRALADRVEQTGEALSADVEAALAFASLSDEERALVDELAELDVAEPQKG